jgi:hypothetical protein
LPRLENSGYDDDNAEDEEDRVDVDEDKECDDMFLSIFWTVSLFIIIPVAFCLNAALY